MSRPGFEPPRPHAPQVGTLAKSYLDSLHRMLFGSSTVLYKHLGWSKLIGFCVADVTENANDLVEW
jgi:hypothetical protein